MAEEKDILRYELDIGQAKAKAEELTRVLDGVGKTGGSGEAAKAVGGTAEALDAVGDAAKNSGHVIEDFDRKGEKLAKGLAGSVNPQFATMLDLFFDLNDGAMKITGSMLGLAAGGLAIGGLISVWRDLNAEIERVKQQMRQIEEEKQKQRSGAIGERAKIAERLAEVGVAGPGAVDAAMQRIDKLMRNKDVPLPLNLATEAAAMEAAGKVSSEDAVALAAGMRAKGVDKIDLKETNVRSLVALGRREKNMNFLRQFAISRKDQTELDRITPRAIHASPEEQALERMMVQLEKAEPGLTDFNKERIRRSASGEYGSFHAFNRSYPRDIRTSLGRFFVPDEQWTETELERDKQDYRLGQELRQKIEGERPVLQSGGTTIINIGTQLNTGSKLNRAGIGRTDYTPASGQNERSSY